MKKILIASFAFVAFVASVAFSKSQCVICHASLGEKHEDILKNFENDIHRQAGLSCHSCHGGNPNTEDIAQAKSSKADFVGAPQASEIPGFCGKCHSKPNFMKKYNPSLPVDQEEKYFTSVHGMKLKAGDANVATCASCHPAHSILPARDPTSSVYAKNIHTTCGRCHANPEHMAPYKIPTDQVTRYLKSVHAKALLERGDMAAPTCNDCHGNHGAAPPGVDNIVWVCGTCHSHNMEYFRESPMGGPWQKKHFHGCPTCHMHHDIEPPTSAMLGGPLSVCGKCHIDTHEGFKVGAAIKEVLDNMEASFNETKDLVTKTQEKGMDVAEAEDSLQEAKQAFFQTRTTVHTFRVEKVKDMAQGGFEALKKAQDFAYQAIREFLRRRIWLGVSTIFITILIIAIYLKLREIEQKP